MVFEGGGLGWVCRVGFWVILFRGLGDFFLVWGLGVGILFFFGGFGGFV